MWKEMPGTLSIPLNDNVFCLREKQNCRVQKYEEKELSHEKCAIGN